MLPRHSLTRPSSPPKLQPIFRGMVKKKQNLFSRCNVAYIFSEEHQRKEREVVAKENRKSKENCNSSKKKRKNTESKDASKEEEKENEQEDSTVMDSQKGKCAGLVSNNFVSLRLNKNFRRGAKRKHAKSKWKSKFKSTYKSTFNEEINKKQCKSLLEEPGSESEEEEEEEVNDDALIEASLSATDLNSCLKEFCGFKNFREGQEQAIDSIIKGESVLVKLATGRGKSLCFQLPTYLLAKQRVCLTIVISPLISLMQDQLERLPAKLHGACLNSSVKGQARKIILEDLAVGKINVLFLSPEMFVSDNFINLIKKKDFPPIGIVCIDEAHCISEWSHNFRPAYLSLSKTIDTYLQDPVVVALTATATRDTQEDICRAFSIGSGNVIEGTPIPSNLKLTVSKEKDKHKALTSLLKSNVYKKYNSIIVYCTRQRDVDDVSGYLQTLKFKAEGYHAGRSPSDRKKIQSDFMKGKIKIIVATIAFGMGIDKCDVRSIVHFNLPKSVENYVQEIGRAGRDQKRSNCHAFFEESDIHSLRSHCFADSPDNVTIKRLLGKVFQKKNTLVGNLSFLDADETELLLDVKKEVIWTLLNGISDYAKEYFELFSMGNFECTMRYLGATPANPSDLFERIVVGVSKIGNLIKKGEYKFNAIELSNLIGEEPRVLFQKFRTASKTFTVSEKEAYIFKILKAPDPSYLDELQHFLAKKTSDFENCQLEKIDAICDLMKRNAVDSVFDYFSCFTESNKPIDDAPMRKDIAEYFEMPRSKEVSSQRPICKPPNEEYVIRTISSFVSKHFECLSAGRNVARIFHGISSPKYSAQDWYSCGVWGKYRHVDFNFIRTKATQEIARLKTGVSL
eukprot:Nk52_evm23s215 gene=Nk52_evmTU23s215